MMKDWTVNGAGDEPILGNAHLPDGKGVGVVLVAHGFKGYKDYGMFPRIAESLAQAGFVAHRFNFSHSGMTNVIETFERPDLFEQDTWNKQVFDLRTVIGAVDDGILDGRGLPYVLFGHSRGGVTVLLAAGRADATLPGPVGIVTASAPSLCNTLSPKDRQKLLADGFIVSPSSRTGQELRIGKAVLTEQLEDPRAHDLLEQASHITCPVLILHGEKDPTVPALCANQLVAAIGPSARAEIIPGADHVFNTPNPMPAESPPSPQLRAMLDALIGFARQVCA